MNWYLFFVIILGVLDIPLIRGMVSDAAQGQPMQPWFIIFYLQNGVLAYLILRPFRKGKLPWYRLFSRICGISLIGLLLLSVLHLLTGKAPDGLILPDLYEARDWTQAAILPLRWVFSFCGIVLMLGRKETRKRAMILGLVYLEGGMLLLGILSGSALRNTAAGNLVANGYIFGFPHLAGLFGALFMRIWGRKAEEEEQRRTASAQRSVAAAPAPTVKPVKPVSPSGPPPEEALQKLQEKYEKEKKKQEPEPEPTPSKEKPAPKREPEPKPAQAKEKRKHDPEPAPAKEKKEPPREDPQPPENNELRPIHGTELDADALLRFIRRILTGSTAQRQAELALNQLAAILQAQNCPPELLDLIQKALEGQKADFSIMQEEALRGLNTAQTLAGAASRAKEAEQRRIEAERYGRC